MIFNVKRGIFLREAKRVLISVSQDWSIYNYFEYSNVGSNVCMPEDQFI